jgi:archaellum component FlaG (FlaF/FlaG flagellin family)
MALTKRTENDKIEILIDGHMQIRTATVIEDDGVEISRSYHRRVIAPDADVANEPDDIKGYAGFARTPTKVAAYIANKGKRP